METSNKKALITGASQGIGLAIAHQMAKEGYQLNLVARSAEKLKAALQQLPGGGHQYLVADLTSEASLATVVTHLEDQHYDVLINNAGYGLYGKFEEIPLEKQLNMMVLNCKAVVQLCYGYLKQARTGDAVVNIASTLGHSSFPGSAAYAGTKGFVIRFSESLWYEYKGRSIFVSAFCPGPTQTDFHELAGKPEHKIPEAATQSAEAVASEMMHFLKNRNKPQGLAGVQNRMMYFLHRFLGRKTTVNMMGALSRSSAILQL